MTTPAPALVLQADYNDPLTVAYGAIVVRETPGDGGEERITLVWPHLDFMPSMSGTAAEVAKTLGQTAARLGKMELIMLIQQAPGLFIPAVLAQGEAVWREQVDHAVARSRNVTRRIKEHELFGEATPNLRHHTRMVQILALLAEGGTSPTLKALSSRLIPVACNPWRHRVTPGLWDGAGAPLTALDKHAASPSPLPNSAAGA